MTQRIVFENPDGTVGVIVPAPGHTIAECIGSIPAAAVSYKVTDVAGLPQSRTFRNAWVVDATGCKVNIPDAKVICHERRREARAAELAPLDEIIMKQIPGTPIADVEAERAAIREKYAVIQAQIDAATTVDELSEIVQSLS